MTGVERKAKLSTKVQDKKQRNPSPIKIDKVQRLVTLLNKATGIYFADYSKVKATDITDLRQKLRTAGVVAKVVKNRLAFLAFKELGYNEALRRFLTGPTALLLTTQDPITPAKLLKDLTQKFTEIKIKGAYVENTIFNAEQFNYIANLPTRAELNATLVGVLSGPIYELVMNLEGLFVQLVLTLEAIGKKEEQFKKEE
uniref:Large ribosomal subunit protein uL10 n=1 Tax=candidate division WOR-3 bacterium TaxID=2052148 RepID=A0A7C6AAB1_UNCW3